MIMKRVLVSLLAMLLLFVSLANCEKKENTINNSENNDLEKETINLKEYKTLTEHSDTVISFSFYLDSKYLVSSSFDGTIKFWDIEKGNVIQSFDDNEIGINSICYSPDGKYIISACGDGNVRIWDISGSNNTKSIDNFTVGVRLVAFSPDGKYLATTDYDGNVNIWDGNLINDKGIEEIVDFVPQTSSDRQLADYMRQVNAAKKKDKEMLLKKYNLKSLGSYHSKNTNVSLAFSPDSKYLAFGSYKNTVKLWNTSTWDLEKVGAIGICVFSPDNKYLAYAGGESNIIKLFDLEKKQDVKTLTGHTDEILSLSFSPDGIYLASCGREENIRIWSVNKGKEIKTLKSSSGANYCINFSPDERYIATSSNVITIWEIPSRNTDNNTVSEGNEENELNKKPEYEIVSISDKYSEGLAVTVFKIKNGDDDYLLEGFCDENKNIAIKPQFIKANDFFNGLSLVHYVDKDNPTKYKGPYGFIDKTGKFIIEPEFIWASNFDKNGEAEVKTSNGDVFYIDKNGKKLEKIIKREKKILKREETPIYIDFSNDSKYIIASYFFNSDYYNYDEQYGSPYAMVIWDVDKKNEYKKFLGTKETYESLLDYTLVDFSNDGKMVASVSNKNLITLWDANSTKKIKVFEADARIKSIKFSPDDKYIAICDEYESVVKLFSVSTGSLVNILNGKSPNEVIKDFCFVPDSNYIFTVEGEIIRKLSIENGNEEGIFVGHSDDVNSIDIEKDGKFIVSASDDKTIRIWNVENYKEVNKFEHSERLYYIKASPDFQHIAFGKDGDLYLWNIEKGEAKLLSSKIYSNNPIFSPDNKYLAYIEETNNSLTNQQYDIILFSNYGEIDNLTKIGDNIDGLALVESSSKKYGYCDGNNKLIIGPKFDAANDFSNGLASVRISDEDASRFGYKGTWGFIDNSGKFVIEPQFKNIIHSFNEEGFAKVITQDDSELYIDKEYKTEADLDKLFMATFMEKLEKDLEEENKKSPEEKRMYGEKQYTLKPKYVSIEVDDESISAEKNELSTAGFSIGYKYHKEKGNKFLELLVGAKAIVFQSTDSGSKKIDFNYLLSIKLPVKMGNFDKVQGIALWKENTLINLGEKEYDVIGEIKRDGDSISIDLEVMNVVIPGFKDEYIDEQEKDRTISVEIEF